ncbi:MAG: hypothetical protein JRH01_08615 [Deltaproteobacteria bacterium]|nr:hypothetical protein [Deltaproteobacteria bacterium]MBW2394421.1 hypothetical protein [Deltaproteobacteria bacterium]
MSKRRSLGTAAFLLGALTLACFVEVNGGASGRSPGSTGLASALEAEFALKAAGASATIHCASGLTGTRGHQIGCEGETSDGFTLEITVLERGAGDFRWDVDESVPIR